MSNNIIKQIKIGGTLYDISVVDDNVGINKGSLAKPNNTNELFNGNGIIDPLYTGIGEVSIEGPDLPSEGNQYTITFGPIGSVSFVAPKGPSGATGPQGEIGPVNYLKQADSDATAPSINLFEDKEYWYINENLSKLTIEGFNKTSTTNTKVATWSIVFIFKNNPPVVSLPNSIIWANGVEPVFEQGKTYWLLFKETPDVNKYLGIWTAW